MLRTYGLVHSFFTIITQSATNRVDVIWRMTHNFTTNVYTNHFALNKKIFVSLKQNKYLVTKCIKKQVVW